MACVNLTRSLTAAILHLFSQETDIFMKVIMESVNIKLWGILGCFHYILNAPRINVATHIPAAAMDKVSCSMPRGSRIFRQGGGGEEGVLQKKND